MSGSRCIVDSKPQRLLFPPSPSLHLLPYLLHPNFLSSSSAFPILRSTVMAFMGCFPSSPSSRCTLQMHQPGVSGCFLFHVRAIPTGPQPNESFPLRYGEKITFRVWSEQSMQHEAHMPSPLCAGARHSLYTRVHATGHTRTQTGPGWGCCVPLVVFSILQSATLAP